MTVKLEVFITSRNHAHYMLKLFNTSFLALKTNLVFV